MTFCTECKDEFTPIEGNVPSEDPEDQSNFCSFECFEKFHASIDAEVWYREAGYSAPVF